MDKDDVKGIVREILIDFLTSAEYEVKADYCDKYSKEWEELEDMPLYMIFDDHPYYHYKNLKEAAKSIY